MKIEQIIRAFAGTIILGSLVLSRMHSEYWLLATGFVGLNLLQSSFTGICPAESILLKLGFKSCASCETEKGV